MLVTTNRLTHRSASAANHTAPVLKVAQWTVSCRAAECGVAMASLYHQIMMQSVRPIGQTVHVLEMT